MEQYIKKSALVTEIEKRKGMCDNHYGDYWNGCYNTFTDILSFIDPLEVKEVDLEVELNNWRHNHFHGRRDKDANGEYLERISQLELAKHFYELGLKAQKGEDV